MNISPDEIAAALRYLIPGFLAVKVFYWFGIKSRRTDLELTLWSVIAAAVVNVAIDLLWPPTAQAAGSPTPDDYKRFLLAGLVGLIVGGIVAGVWRLAYRQSAWLRVFVAVRSWDAVLAESNWLQVWTKDGKVFLGCITHMADPADTDDLDIYLSQPEAVDGDGQRTPILPETDGLLIARSEILRVQVFKPVEKPKEPPETGLGARGGVTEGASGGASVQG